MKKIIKLCVCIFCIWILMDFPVYASEMPTFAVSEAEGEVGEQVKIQISTQNNTGIISFKLLVGYDKTALKLVDMKGKDFSDVAFGPMDVSPAVVNWVDSIHPNNETNGVAAELVFEILETAQAGKSEITLAYDPEDVFDFDFENVSFGVQNGGVNIIKEEDTENVGSAGAEEDAGSEDETENEPDEENVGSAGAEEDAGSEDETENEQGEENVGSVGAEENAGSEDEAENAGAEDEAPSTADTAQPLFWGVLLIISICIVCAGIWRKRIV